MYTLLLTKSLVLITLPHTEHSAALCIPCVSTTKISVAIVTLMSNGPKISSEVICLRSEAILWQLSPVHLVTAYSTPLCLFLCLH